MEQGALERVVGGLSWPQLVLGAIGLFLFSAFVLVVVLAGAVSAFLWWFVYTPILAALAATRRWRRPAR